MAKKEKYKKMTIEQIVKKLAKLKSDRGTLESHLQEITDYINPRKNTITSDKTPGAKRTFQLLDNSGVLSNELLAGALHSLLTNPDGIWFEMTTGDLQLDQNDNVRGWMQKQVRKMHNVLNNSNFQTEVHELYIDLPSICTGCMQIEEDEEYIVRFSTKFIRDYYIDEDHRGYVNQVYREWKWSCEQLIAEFGLEAVGEKVQKAYKDGKAERFTVIHAVYPKTLCDPEGKDDGMPFLSQWVLPEQKHELRVGGFKQFPYVTPRWSKAAGEMYGRGPGMTALPEIKVLNKMNETMLIGAQKVVDPPLQLPDDGFIMPIVTRPGGLNYYRSGTTDMIKPIFNDTRVDFAYQTIEDRRKRVRDAFYVDQLKLSQDQKYMTATEVLQRTEESMRLLGPTLGRMQSEFLRPLIERLYGLMKDRGLIDAAPAELKDKPLDIRYSSLIAKSQRLNEGQNVIRTFQTVAPFIQMDPTVADNFNGDNAVRVVAHVLGLPQEILRDAKDVQKIRDQRAKQQQEMMDQQKQQQQSESFNQGIQAMQKLGQASGQEQ